MRNAGTLAPRAVSDSERLCAKRSAPHAPAPVDVAARRLACQPPLGCPAARAVSESEGRLCAHSWAAPYAPAPLDVAARRLACHPTHQTSTATRAVSESEGRPCAKWYAPHAPAPVDVAARRLACQAPRPRWYAIRRAYSGTTWSTTLSIIASTSRFARWGRQRAGPPMPQVGLHGTYRHRHIPMLPPVPAGGALKVAPNHSRLLFAPRRPSESLPRVLNMNMTRGARPCG